MVTGVLWGRLGTGAGQGLGGPGTWSGPLLPPPPFLPFPPGLGSRGELCPGEPRWVGDLDSIHLNWAEAHEGAGRETGKTPGQRPSTSPPLVPPPPNSSPATPGDGDLGNPSIGLGALRRHGHTAAEAATKPGTRMRARRTPAQPASPTHSRARCPPPRASQSARTWPAALARRCTQPSTPGRRDPREVKFFPWRSCGRMAPGCRTPSPQRCPGQVAQPGWSSYPTSWGSAQLPLGCGLPSPPMGAAGDSLELGAGHLEA